MDVGPPELLIILVIVLVLFGGAKLPQLARSLSEAQREFRKGAEGHTDDPEPKAKAPADTKPADEALPAEATAAEPVEATATEPAATAPAEAEPTTTTDA